MSSSIQPRDKMAQYRDAALDFYNNGQTQPALGDMLAGVDLPPTPRGGPDNISRGEYEDLTKKLKTVARATQKQNRSWWHNALLKLSWWHVVLVMIINDVTLIA